MKKKKLIVLSILLILVVISILILKNNFKQNKTNKQDSINNIENILDKKNRNNTTSWIKYNNPILGFSFEYPDTWEIQEVESDINEKITSKFIQISNPKTQTFIKIIYKLPPKGSDLYYYRLKEFQSNSFKSKLKKERYKVSGNEAIMTTNELGVNGKGKTLIPKIRAIRINFLDKGLLGSFEIQFKTPVSDYEEISVLEFRKILSSFKLI